MNKLAVKIVSIGVCTALCAGGIGGLAYALGEDLPEETQKDEIRQTVQTEAPINKDETVYVLAGADGSVQKIIVSDWIRNNLEQEEIADKTELSGIENVKGDETYAINESNGTVWDAKGNDIYYQGTIEKELPVALSLSYQLDGKPISADDLAGKSGKVKIRFDYKNRQYETVTIDGKKETIYVPFAMLTGLLLDNDCFRNVEVTNGKIINDGDRTAVIGIAFPGLQENLGMDREKLEIPDYVEISADVNRFEFGMTVTVATNEVFNGFDTAKLDSLDGLTGSLEELTEAVGQLVNGSSELYGGLCTLLEKSNTLVDGIQKLAAGAKALQDGIEAADLGAGQLKNGAADLRTGLSAITANNADLTGGAKQVFDTLLATANAQITAAGLNVPKLTIENYAAVLEGVIQSLDQNAVYRQALAQVTEAVEQNRAMIEGKVTETVREQVQASVESAVRIQVEEQVIATATGGTMNRDTYQKAVSAGRMDSATQAQIEAAIAQKTADASVKALIQAKTDEQMKSASIRKTIEENTKAQIEKAISDNMASAEVQSRINAAAQGLQTLTTLKASLDSYNSFYRGLIAYTDGVSAAEQGASQLQNGTENLKNGTEQLKAGADELYNGILQLKNGTPALIEGITQLKGGAMQLSDGLKQFQAEGVQKIVDAVDGDLGSLLTRTKATVDVSKAYRNFSGLGSNMDGQVKFIYRTDSIEQK